MKNALITSIFFVATLGMFLPGCGPISPLSPVEPLIQFYLVWRDGEAVKYYRYNSDVVYRSMRRSCKRLGYDIERDDGLDENDNYYVVAGANDRFKIKVEQVETNISRMKIRVNFLGDKPYAELIYKEVDRELNVIEFDNEGNPIRQNRGFFRRR